jgi:hypothetical protein
MDGLIVHRAVERPLYFALVVVRSRRCLFLLLFVFAVIQSEAKDPGTDGTFQPKKPPLLPS